ncbi:sigma-54-dependent Fis family transcriptional regulator [Pedobacter frigiditerrae]|uniref:Sigma-54-dependent Fis family transcriptional regulator n=1 Tax=Pedobacter frigiditerrae TaxID=2530452 RepID=A0A4R0MNZ0_9SPHI|nr:sigma-54 dependent transcriptional regulator [Pedobacter frigiditerrae]TCC88528.1 sigma-54-dependent Fis family transcriptional regulator [Pedobacter frigiditerrae]
MEKRILIVEDEFIEANNLRMILERNGYKVCTVANSVALAIEIVENEKPELVLLDIFLKGKQTGIDLAHVLRKKSIAFVYLSANSNKEIFAAAKKTEPYGFLVKPFREKDVLATLDIAQYLHEQKLAIHRQEDRLSKVKEVAQFTGIVGKSPQLAKVLDLMRIVAPTDTSVLITGESGTGKERVLECIHENSERRNKPLVKVNCAVLPATLIESELFGFEKGSFSGAHETRVGKFEQAQGGTIFLDEIGELPLDLQSKLLRVLQEKEIERIGGRSSIKVNVRFVAATNRNLEREVAEGRFRIDLYYRINVFPIHLPALRQRKEDIPLLAQHFLGQYSRINNKKFSSISARAMEQMENYSWPGNIRELEHLMERSVLLNKGDQIAEVFLPLTEGSSVIDVNEANRIKTIRENEIDHIITVLKICKGKISGPGGAAEMLDLPYSTLTSRIKKYGITKEMIYKD